MPVRVVDTVSVLAVEPVRVMLIVTAAPPSTPFVAVTRDRRRAKSLSTIVAVALAGEPTA